MSLDALNKYAGGIFLYLIGALFAGVIAYQIVVGQTINVDAYYFVSLIVLQAVHQGGVSQGVTTTNDTVAKTAAAVPAATKGATGPVGPTGATGPAGPIGGTT